MDARQNPLFSANRLKLGAFGINGDSNSRTLVPERYDFNWPNSLDVAVQADRLGFEAIVPYARFRSIVEPRHHSGAAFECFSWSGAIAAKTRTSCIMSTVHVTNVHPIIAAKAMTTIDHISGGRFALNIVCGWFKEEAEMFGTPFLDHDERYAYADEWISAIKRLWMEDEEFDFDGRYIQVHRGQAQPKPLQKPCPPLMNAGGSPQGRNFVSKHCDIAFVRGDSYELMQSEASAYRSAARALGRDIQIWTPCAVVQGESDADAKRICDYYADNADEPYVNSFFEYAKKGLSPEEARTLKRRFAVSGNGLLIAGGPEKIADEMRRVSAAGVDGLLIAWVDFQNGIRRFGEAVLPLLEQQGLRRAQ